jgi:hypothetical protein
MTENYDLTCMMCGSLVGQFSAGEFVEAGQTQAAQGGGRLPCSRCGGSLYLELMGSYASSLDPRVRRARAEAETLIHARRSPRSAATSAVGADVAHEVAVPGAA